MLRMKILLELLKNLSSKGECFIGIYGTYVENASIIFLMYLLLKSRKDIIFNYTKINRIPFGSNIIPKAKSFFICTR